MGVPAATWVSSSFCSAVSMGELQIQSMMVTVPALPSTRTRWPVLMFLVPNAVPVTAGRPYSRHTIAAWLMIPPTSVTVASILPNTGGQPGAVSGATRTSPSRRSAIPSADRMTRAGPSATPGEAAKPDRPPAESGPPSHWRTLSEGVPPSRRAPGPAVVVVEQHLGHLVPGQQEHVVDVGEEIRGDQHPAEVAHLPPDHRMRPVLDVEVMVLHVREHRAGQPELGLERSPVLVAVDQVGVLVHDAVALGDDGLHRPFQRLAPLHLGDVGAQEAERDVRGLPPYLVAVVEGGAGR